MGLSIAVFVPEGIVVATDGLEEIHNADEDQGFLHKKLKRLFVYNDRYIICTHGYGFINGLPCAYYIEKVFASFGNIDFHSVSEFAEILGDKLSFFINKNAILSFYVFGMDERESDETVPCIVLYDNGQLFHINRGKENQIVYNYHSMGRSFWLNKLLLPTSYTIDEAKKIDFDSVDVDFSKYSIDDAVDFINTLFRLSREMDNITQLKQMIGEYLTIGILTLDGQITLKNNCTL